MGVGKSVEPAVDVVAGPSSVVVVAVVVVIDGVSASVVSVFAGSVDPVGSVGSVVAASIGFCGASVCVFVVTFSVVYPVSLSSDDEQGSLSISVVK